MSENNYQDSSSFTASGKPKLPTGINVLTILTLIWCAVELYSNLSNFFGGRKKLDDAITASEKFKDADVPKFAKNFFGPDMIAMLEKAYENRVPMFILGLVATLLCIYGAIQMRQLKKQGYILWLVGELLPILSIIIFIGAGFYANLTGIMLIFPILFIILYTAQRKHLVK